MKHFLKMSGPMSQKTKIRAVVWSIRGNESLVQKSEMKVYICFLHFLCLTDNFLFINVIFIFATLLSYKA